VGEPSDGPQRCPRKLGYVLVSQATGQTIPAYCDANSCDYCAPRRASIVAKAISLSMPERAVRLSKLTGEWQRDRRRINKTVERLRERGYKVEWAYHLEENPRETGFHAHAWQHGDYVPQDELQDVCRSAGLGIPFINRMRQRTGRSGGVSYGLKGVRYGMKSEDLSGFLDLNGGRLVHATRNFWRDGVDGERLTLESARALVRTPGEDPGPWSLRAEL
jgi:hypothetical protein